VRGGSRSRSGLLIVVFALLIAAAAPAALGATGDGPATGSAFESAGDSLAAESVAGPSASVAAQQEPPGENNSSVAHRNPSEVSDSSSLGDVEAWLSREMAGRLAKSANLSQADRDRARELVGNDSEYAELAARYSQVANQSGSGGEANDFATAGQLQREFFLDVETYYQIHEAYRDARQNNETNRTLRLAHELERRAAAVNHTAGRLNRSYANISADEQGHLRNATQTIGEMRGNVTRTQQTVRNQSLARTTLSVQATEPSGSFADPVPLAGRLLTAEGYPVANETVTLLVGNKSIDVTTGERGRFEIGYRPTSAPMGDRIRTVTFLPGNESAYRWASATAEFGVEQVTPNVSVSNRTATVRYNQTLTVNGTVAAGGVGVPDLPVVVTVDGVRISQVRTDANGSFGAAGRLPGNVSNGSQSVRIQVVPKNATTANRGRYAFGPGSNSNAGLGSESETKFDAEPARDVAIAPVNGSVGVTVESTPTSLSIGDVRTFNDTAYVSGRLTTGAGEPLANQTVEIRVGGQSVGTATTNATGGIATTVGLPSRTLAGDGTIRVVATYSPPGGNLDPSTAERTAKLASTGPMVSDRHLRYGAAGLLAVAALGAFVWRFRSSDGSADEGAEPADETVGDPGASERADGRERSAGALLESAATALDDRKPDAAVVGAYGAIRRRFEGADGRRSGGDGWRSSGDGRRSGTDALMTEARGRGSHRTHWEFYVACQDAGLSDEALGRLEGLTETYERAAFADGSVSEADARTAVADARALQEAADAELDLAGRGSLHGEFPGGERPGRDSGNRGGSPAD
jgi:hypothetical protein